MRCILSYINERKHNSAPRTADQTAFARLCQAMGPVDENRAARSVVPRRNSLVDGARRVALLNMATCDALIASMEPTIADYILRNFLVPVR